MGIFTPVYGTDLPHRAKLVYIYLRDRADKEGKCWPAIRTIAKDLSLSRSTVKRALDDLVEGGHITKEFRYRENSSLTSNMYRIR